MKILFHAPAAWCTSGYANQVRYLLPRLQEHGHEVAVVAYGGLAGSPIEHEGIQHYPEGLAFYACDVVVPAAKHFGAEMVVSLGDAFVFDALPRLCFEAGIAWHPHFPVDHDPVPFLVRNTVEKSARALCFSKWGTLKAEEVDLDNTRHIPLCVPMDVFRKRDRSAARRKFGFPEDAFLVGMVSGNYDQHDRKSFGFAFEAFAQFRAQAPEAHLYVHTVFDPRKGGFDLLRMARGIGIDDVTTFPDPYKVMLGYSDDEMAELYSAFDVLLCPSRAEGFGVPIVEAQACGTPVIIGGWTSMPELFSGSGVMLKRFTPVWTYQCSRQFQPVTEEIAEALGTVYCIPQSAEQARAHVEQYDPDVVIAEYWTPFLIAHEAILEERAGGSMPSRLTLNQAETILAEVHRKQTEPEEVPVG